MAFLVYTQILYSPSPMIYQHSSLFILNASLNHLPLASFYLWSCPSCWAEITYSFRRVRPTGSKSPISVMPISLVSLFALSQPSKHRYHTLVSFEILFPFPKSFVCHLQYKNQPRKVVHPLENLHWTPNPEKWIGDLLWQAEMKSGWPGVMRPRRGSRNLERRIIWNNKCIQRVAKRERV